MSAQHEAAARVRARELYPKLQRCLHYEEAITELAAALAQAEAEGMERAAAYVGQILAAAIRAVAKELEP